MANHSTPLHIKYPRIHSGPNFDLPGVVHIFLNNTAQQALNCVVDETIKWNKTWQKFDKYLVLDQITSPDFTPFLPHKQAIIDFPEDDMMIGYLPDELSVEDEFYFCTNITAQQAVTEIIEKVNAKWKAWLSNAIIKYTKPWASLGSEIDVDYNIHRKSRGLYAVEVSTKYYRFQKVRLTKRLAEDVKSGYLEIIVTEKYQMPIVAKKRVDMEIQVRPTVDNNYAQTVYEFPKNMWSQYLYEYNAMSEFTDDFAVSLCKFMKTALENISDMMDINANLNLYTYDFKNLSVERIIKQPPVMKRNEFMSLKDVKICKNKIISALVWHPIWNGIIAIAYSNNSTSRNIEDDYDSNPVLIWSIDDPFHAKAMLESHSEVHCLAFCPHNEFLLIGGCCNGQVILWDITNKINLSVCHEIKPLLQSKALMYSVMKWSYHTKSVLVVPPTVIAKLQNAHNSNVTSVNWVNPEYEISKLGVCNKIDIDIGESSLQFVSSSSDGCLYVWDLKQEYVFINEPKTYGLVEEIPAPLRIHESVYKGLNGKLVPHYIINILQSKLQIPLRTLTFSEHNEFIGGSYLGDFIIGKWEGIELYDEPAASDRLYEEDAKFLNIKGFHDGPIVCVQKHPKFNDVYLTVGGSVFAIWMLHYKNKPVFWRRTKHKYTHGHWSCYIPTGIRLNRSDGNREIWDLKERSDRYFYDVDYTGRGLFESAVHPHKRDRNVMGLSDDSGALRLVYIPQDIADYNDNEPDFLLNLLENNASMKNSFNEWQTRKYGAEIIAKQKKEENEKLVKIAELRKEERRIRLQNKKDMIETARIEAAKLIPPPGRLAEWCEEKRVATAIVATEKLVLTQKGLDKEETYKQIQPKLDELASEKVKIKKLRQYMSKSDQFFAETTKVVFPNIRISDIGKVEDGKLLADELMEIKRGYYNAYQEIKSEMELVIKSNRYVKEFNWRKLVADTKIKRGFMESEIINSRKFKRSITRQK